MSEQSLCRLAMQMTYVENEPYVGNFLIECEEKNIIDYITFAAVILQVHDSGSI